MLSGIIYRQMEGVICQNPSDIRKWLEVVVKDATFADNLIETFATIIFIASPFFTPTKRF
jgi:hypothetical protein